MDEVDKAQARLEQLFGEDELMKGAGKPAERRHNPVARALRTLRPKVRPSVKTYRRKLRHAARLQGS